MSSTDSTEIRISGIARDSIVDGEGIRLTVFTQGCPRRCPGCHNPETQPLVGGRTTTVGAVVAELDENPLLTGLTLSGGEPFLQPGALLPLARAAHARGLDVWSYTGFTLEELRAQGDTDVDALLEELDVLVDGDYREELRDLTLHFRGSRNQRVIDLAATRRTGELTLLYAND
ncbi:MULTISPECIES: anaerobic ribonucleoside-triphosphate reductase activating protein [Selenomonas]|uniref:Anaerobic ribonucleoside-triphosphate reductase-activating protein n=1 Tax=Selenomonas artemidis F0399 TaxID=749551 RepID=E7N3M8_9FIRM|nr:MULTISPECIES: anaerobic ribonucleoside-triphosphate reductase activating protein [Selenomonas]EFR41845.1 anaerobic ribonucleoside-triphosphate reductase activating protein [Selenomonas sp. oral taxon 137 str. F0430]EFW29213.1 anaerobic ribonucleoside-triphosphate reductase activating protein [Selenomonas artemidis F0399]EJP32968.1 anaerobic ribonucleoside-triphosphate reductase activating protein [Selenomonas sp. FOBRC9]